MNSLLNSGVFRDPTNTGATPGQTENRLGIEFMAALKARIRTINDIWPALGPSVRNNIIEKEFPNE